MIGTLVSDAKQKIPIISDITSDDKEKYENFFNKIIYRRCYSCGWIYITQAARFTDTKLHLGLKFLTEDCLITIGIHNEHFVIIRPLGNYIKYLPSLLEELKKSSGKNVYIKKMTPIEIENLKDSGVQLSRAIDYLFSWDEIPGNDSNRLIEFLKKKYSIDWVKTAKIEKSDDGKIIRVFSGKNYLYLSRLLEDKKTEVDLKIDDGRTDEFFVRTENDKLNIYDEKYPWSKSAPEDDDTFPEVIIDINKILDHYDKTPCRDLRNIRLSIRRFRNRKYEIIFKPYHKGLSLDVYEYLIKHFGPGDSAFAEAYENMLKYPPNGLNGEKFFSFVTTLKDRIVGFFLAERVDDESAALYASVGSRERELGGLTEYLFIELMKRLRDAGIKYLNLGGSEVEGLHHFKLKFSPFETKKLDIFVYGL